MKIEIVNYGIITITSEKNSTTNVDSTHQVVMKTNTKSPKTPKQSMSPQLSKKSSSKERTKDGYKELVDTTDPLSPRSPPPSSNDSPHSESFPKLSNVPTEIQPVAPFSFFNINGVTESMVTSLESWTTKKRRRLVYDSSMMDFSKESFYNAVCGLSNIMTLVVTDKGYVFGAFHSSIPNPPTQGSKTFHDNNFFIFTLINADNIPQEKFFKKSSLETMYLDSLSMSVESIYTISRGFTLKKKGSSFSPYFASFYQIEKRRGSKFFVGSVEPETFEVARLVAIEWLN
ncbi:hypothetical protein EIN_227250 [Entamoeba invadens IP1]|uniref:TLDc domain-containing protein n=1 Tax=Entamoeba invadens IP1 TaxID=370355 RepID=A0A0A1U2M7_ENTIV|nr:hypothetical protein EIN_227250 [Entamoeba invadens IP1]ELP88312.1 hypothetical protein EIN_227250 [Entamoeba invadens IP1]|eukprot:XP_004255083.1 hypothetical protein EIN_227250 [Entamoeba invadens IP1]